MPINRRQDKNGPFYQYGDTGHKYYYIPNNKRSREIAYEKCRKQGQAITISKIKRGTYYK
jgi:hypothetical protein